MDIERQTNRPEGGAGGEAMPEAKDRQQDGIQKLFAGLKTSLNVLDVQKM